MKIRYFDSSNRSTTKENSKIGINYRNELRISLNHSTLHNTLRTRLKTRIHFPSSTRNLKGNSTGLNRTYKLKSRNVSQFSKINPVSTLNNKEILAQTLNCDFMENWINNTLKFEESKYFGNNNSFGNSDRLNAYGIDREQLEVTFTRVKWN